MIHKLIPLLLLLALIGCQEDTTVAKDPIPPDEETPAAPSITIKSPADGFPNAQTLLDVSGTALWADRILISVDDSEPVIIAGTDKWITTLRLAPGTHHLKFEAVGEGGMAHAETTIHQGRLYTLAPPAPLSDGIELRLNKLTLQRILSPEDQEKIIIAHLDLVPLVRNALAALADPDAWGVDTTKWGQAEWNLATLLTISADSADLSDTALFPLMDLSGRLGLSPSRVLSEMLQVAPSAPLFDSGLLADALIDTLIRTHPNWQGNADGHMAVTLRDALADLSTLADRYGPSGGHPGFIAEPPRAELFTPAFAMVVQGKGNLRSAPGLRPGMGFASHLIKPPAGTPILDLDFEDPARFRVEGLHPEPRVALTMGMAESPEYFAVTPGIEPAPRGPSPIWDANPWILEGLIAEAGYRAYSTLYEGPQTFIYGLGAIEQAAVIDWQDGFINIDVVADLGPPPPPAYIWDLVLDVAQARLHDNGLAEGQVKATLALPLLPVGLSAEELIDIMRPELQSRKEQMVNLMLGSIDDLDSQATIWLDGDTLRAVEGTKGFYDTPDMAGEALTEIPATEGQWWTESPEGARYVLISEGMTDDSSLKIGMVEVPR